MTGTLAQSAATVGGALDEAAPSLEDVSVPPQLEAAYRYAHLRGEEAGDRVEDGLGGYADTHVGRAAQVGTVIAVVVIAVVALVGILIMAQVETALPELSSNTSDDNYSPLAGEVDNVVGGFGDAMGFVPIILIVLLASIVIMAVQRMR